MKPKGTGYGMNKNATIWVADFETTVYEGQHDTQVWAAAIVEMYTEEVRVFNSLLGMFEFVDQIPGDVKIYFHNLKFDGSFWLPFLLNELRYKQAVYKIGDDTPVEMFYNDRDMPDKTFKYSISDRGIWYSITIRSRKRFIQIVDSMKLLPMSVERIGKSFQTKHKKLSIKYDGKRYPGGEIKQDEREYIANDVLVVKEGLEYCFNEGHDKLTIGSCCLYEFKKGYGKEDWKIFFPDLYKVEINSDVYGATNADEYIRKAYHGGWSYVRKDQRERIQGHGYTIDVNSLYPSVMHSDSGNRYPVGFPKFWSGNGTPKICQKDGIYFYIRFRCKFRIKERYLPFVQIKNSFLYKENEMLETSDIYNHTTGKYVQYYTDENGEVIDTAVTMTMSCADYRLFLEHYYVKELEILDGCWFHTEIGLFDEYLNKYKKMKIENVGGKRELAKLFQNNLYGKLASSKISSYKVAYEKPNGVLAFRSYFAEEKTPGYIAIGAAITSYARNFTIRHAQKNYEIFRYADTDSLHLETDDFNKVNNIVVHPTDYLCWKVEGEWDTAIFTRQKTYIEHIIGENFKRVNPHYLIKCAGMPEKSKNILNCSLSGALQDIDFTNLHTADDILDFMHACYEEEFDEEIQRFILHKRSLTDFVPGLKVPGCLKPRRMRSGVLLKEDFYTMK